MLFCFTKCLEVKLFEPSIIAYNINVYTFQYSQFLLHSYEEGYDIPKCPKDWFLKSVGLRNYWVLINDDDSIFSKSNNICRAPKLRTAKKEFQKPFEATS